MPRQPASGTPERWKPHAYNGHMGIDADLSEVAELTGSRGDTRTRIYGEPERDRHKRKPVMFRPSQTDRKWLYTYAETNRRTVNDVLSEALSEYRKAHSRT